MTTTAKTTQTDMTQITRESTDTTALAYIMPFRRDEYMVFAPYVSQEFIECPPILAMPTAVPYGFGLIEWRQRLIPLIDFDALIYRHNITRAEPPFALVLAYRQNDGQIGYGAIATDSVPDSIHVSDKDLCALPTNSKLWTTLAVSCINYRGIAAPIINTDALFSRRHAS